MDLLFLAYRLNEPIKEYEDDCIKINPDGSITGKPLKEIFIYNQKEEEK